MLGDSKARAATQRRAAPCGRCGEPASAEVWGHPLCAVCWGDWLADEQFSAGAIDRHLAGSGGAGNQVEQYCVEATRRTAVWVRAGAAINPECQKWCVRLRVTR